MGRAGIFMVPRTVQWEDDGVIKSKPWAVGLLWKTRATLWGCRWIGNTRVGGELVVAVGPKEKQTNETTSPVVVRYSLEGQSSFKELLPKLPCSFCAPPVGFRDVALLLEAMVVI